MQDLSKIAWARWRMGLIVDATPVHSRTTNTVRAIRFWVAPEQGDRRR